MWYVIPFAILLIILFILKKRESNKLNEKPTQATKSAQKIQESEQAPPPSTTTTSTANTTPTQTNQTALNSNILQELQQINPLTIHNIELLISEKKFSLAEALINKTLKQHPDSAALFLYLLDIHLELEDQMAIEQLINYLQNANKKDILAQIQAKKAAQLQPSKDEFPETHRSDQSPIFDEEIVLAQQANADLTATGQPLFTDLEFEQKSDISIAKTEAQPERQALEFVIETVEPEPNQISEDSAQSSFNELENLEFNVAFSDAAVGLENNTENQPIKSPIDPISKIYPEATTCDEVELNLILAEYYIKLGAFDAASRLISEQEQQYNDLQRQQSQNLLNSMAS